MVKVSTLFHRVDGFKKKDESTPTRELPVQNREIQILKQILEPVLFDPGDELVQRTLRRI
jgi:hypothetical protein